MPSALRVSQCRRVDWPSNSVEWLCRRGGITGGSDGMDLHIFGVVAACLIVALTALLIPMVPGGQVDTRDFEELPRWQFRTFNVALVTLGVVGLAVAAAVPGGQKWALWAATAVGAGYLLVFALDLGRVFPVVADPMPPHLLVLEVHGGVLGAVLILVGVLGAVS